MHMNISIWCCSKRDPSSTSNWNQRSKAVTDLKNFKEEKAPAYCVHMTFTWHQLLIAERSIPYICTSKPYCSDKLHRRKRDSISGDIWRRRILTSSDHPTPCKGPQTEEMEEETEETADSSRRYHMYSRKENPINDNPFSIHAFRNVHRNQYHKWQFGYIYDHIYTTRLP